MRLIRDALLVSQYLSPIRRCLLTIFLFGHPGDITRPLCTPQELAAEDLSEEASDSQASVVAVQRRKPGRPKGARDSVPRRFTANLAPQTDSSSDKKEERNKIVVAMGSANARTPHEPKECLALQAERNEDDNASQALRESDEQDGHFAVEEWQLTAVGDDDPFSKDWQGAVKWLHPSCVQLKLHYQGNTPEQDISAQSVMH